MPEDTEKLTDSELLTLDNLRFTAKKRGDARIKKRLTIPDARKLRNLTQYRDLSDEEFEETYAKIYVGVQQNKEFEGRIQRKLESFAENYDLEDLNNNDKLTLRALAQSFINLEDYELQEYTIRKDGISLDNVMLLEKIAKVKSDLRADISKLSDDLKITRRVRKSDKDLTVASYLETLKKKAKEFYESKLQLVFCPNCNTWIGSVWCLYPNNKQNKVTFMCERELEDGKTCGTKVTYTVAELIEMGGTNKSSIPESMK